jgi:hypothetical protein
MLYLYCIIDQPNAEFALPQGLGDNAVEVVTCGKEGEEVGAVVSEIAKEPARDAKSAHTHMNVLTELMQQCVVLPLQFGISFLSRDELIETVNRLHASLREDLRRLSGQVEVNVKVTDRSPLLAKPVCELTGETGEGETASGGDENAVRYVTSKGANIKIRAQQSRGNELLAETIQAPFAGMVTGKIWRAVPSPSGKAQINANFLLPREQFDAFQNGVEDLKETAPRLDVRLTGPWPPFSFMSEEGAVKAVVEAAIAEQAAAAENAAVTMAKNAAANEAG